jgi:hypothetical protein
MGEQAVKTGINLLPNREIVIVFSYWYFQFLSFRSFFPETSTLPGSNQATVWYSGNRKKLRDFFALILPVGDQSC